MFSLKTNTNYIFFIYKKAVAAATIGVGKNGKERKQEKKLQQQTEHYFATSNTKRNPMQTTHSALVWLHGWSLQCARFARCDIHTSLLRLCTIYHSNFHFIYICIATDLQWTKCKNQKQKSNQPELAHRCFYNSIY